MSWNPDGYQPPGQQPPGWQPGEADVSVGLTGIAVSSTQGDVDNGVAVPVYGSAIASALGTFVDSAGGWQPDGWQPDGWQPSGWQPSGLDLGIALTGAAMSGSTGNFSVDFSKSLSGQPATAAAGSLAYEAARALIGAAVNASTGFITTGSDINVALSGQAVSAALNSLSPLHAAALTGNSATASNGTIAITRALALLGIPFTISQGDVTYQEGSYVVIGLTGLSAAMSQSDMAIQMATALVGSDVEIMHGSTYAVIPPTGGSDLPVPSAVGSLASPNPWLSTVTDESPAGVAGPNGCIMGRFAWLSENGTVTNARLASTDRLCFVLMNSSGYGAVYWSNGRAVLHPGCPVTLMSFGDFWARFEYGAVQGAQVYADKATGKPISGYSASGEATPWWVVTNAPPGELAIISTTSRVQ